jgi:tRNA(Ile)-lysidine synthase
VVAVSGGVDSMALCTLLAKHREAEGWPKTVFAYTIDHGVRPGSSEEARKVGEWVTQLGIYIRECFLTLGFQHGVEKLTSDMSYKVLAANKPGNLETILRMHRTPRLSTLAEKHSADAVLLGHQEDDQYETVVMRLSSGSSLLGLRGISNRAKPSQAVKVRPLLDYSKVSFSEGRINFPGPFTGDL